MSWKDVEAVIVVVLLTLVPNMLLAKSMDRKVLIPAKQVSIFPPMRLSDMSIFCAHGKQHNSSGNSPINWLDSIMITKTNKTQNSQHESTRSSCVRVQMIGLERISNPSCMHASMILFPRTKLYGSDGTLLLWW
jgi:hypothetical protein